MWIPNETYTVALCDGGMLVPAALLLIVLGGLVHFRILRSRISLNFQLRSLESVELDRSVLLYKKVQDRRSEIYSVIDEIQGDLLTRYQRRKTTKQTFAEELEDIEGYGKHLRSTIERLRRKPIQRLRSWMHVCSAEMAFGRCLIVYAVICCVGLIELYCLEQLLVLDEMQVSFAFYSHWEHLRGPMLYANWAAAGFTLAAWPAVYLHRRVDLNRQYRLQLRLCKEFAVADPDRLIEQLRATNAEGPSPQPSGQIGEQGTCFDVLGLSPEATIEEVKEAYRERVKQSHPDRVRGMSSAFTALAEAETKRLNAAYEEALLSLQGLLTA